MAQTIKLESENLRISKAFLILVLLTCLPCNADDSEALSIAKRVAMGGQYVDIDANAQQMATMLISSNPGLANHELEIVEILKEHLQSEELLNGIAIIYVDNFSLDELKELELLMQNSVMIKWLANMPTIMPRIVKVQRESLARVFPRIEKLLDE